LQRDPDVVLGKLGGGVRGGGDAVELGDSQAGVELALR